MKQSESESENIPSTRNPKRNINAAQPKKSSRPKFTQPSTGAAASKQRNGHKEQATQTYVVYYGGRHIELLRSSMYATSLPPRRNPRARIAENYAPRFSPSELPLLPANWIPSWRSPPTKIWGDGGGDQPGTAAAVAAAASCAKARPSTTG